MKKNNNGTMVANSHRRDVAVVLSENTLLLTINNQEQVLDVPEVDPSDLNIKVIGQLAFDLYNVRGRKGFSKAQLDAAFDQAVDLKSLGYSRNLKEDAGDLFDLYMATSKVVAQEISGVSSFEVVSPLIEAAIDALFMALAEKVGHGRMTWPKAEGQIQRGVSLLYAALDASALERPLVNAAKHALAACRFTKGAARRHLNQEFKAYIRSLGYWFMGQTKK